MKVDTNRTGLDSLSIKVDLNCHIQRVSAQIKGQYNIHGLGRMVMSISSRNFCGNSVPAAAGLRETING